MTMINELANGVFLLMASFHVSEGAHAVVAHRGGKPMRLLL